MTTTPHTPLLPKYLGIRREIMNDNGINWIHPLGRDYDVPRGDFFEPYNGICFSLFGYVINPRPVCEFGVFNNDNGATLIKTSPEGRLVIVSRPSGAKSYTYTTVSNGYYEGTQFVFRFRAAYERSIDKNAVKAIEIDTNHYTQPMGIYPLRLHEYFSQYGSHVFLSTHLGNYHPSEFPLGTGLGPITTKVILLEVGSYAVYEGIYSGADAISIVAPGAVRDLGRPLASGVNVKIGVRKNLAMYVFLTDYGSAPVAAPFAELVTKGHQYIPEFSQNFNIRRVQIEAYY